MYPRDGDATKGTMEMTTTVPAEYYTYNTEYKTLIYTNPDNDAQFYMGSSGTYKSISTSAISYITSETSYVAHFYAEKVEHTCEFVAGKVVDPTCTEDGYTVYTCTCGKTENRDTVAATGHVNTTEEVTPATCTADGVKKVVCACGEVLSTETLPATGHNFVDGTCANGCGTTEEHVCEFVVSDKVVAPTCTEAGYTVYTCTCGLTENRDHVDALGHAYSEEVTAPTCTEAGYTTHTCANCKDTYTDTEVEALGHEFSAGTAVDPTCTAAGYTPYTCANCGTVENRDTVDALGHDYVEGVCSVCQAKDPNHYFVMTIAEALTAADDTKVQVTGTVIKINTPYSDSYDNITVTIADEAGDQLYVYRLKGNVELNQIITIKGVMDTYSGARQIAAGATFEAIGTHVCSNYSDATCTKPSACVVCGTVLNEELADHNYVDGTCTECGGVEGVSYVTESLDIAANTGVLGDKTITWTGTNFTLVNAQASSTTAIRTSDTDHFRAYAKSETTISGSKITKVVITCTSSSYATACANSLTTTGVTATVDGTVVTLTVNSGTVDSILLTATAQWRFNKIEVTCQQ